MHPSRTGTSKNLFWRAANSLSDHSPFGRRLIGFAAASPKNSPPDCFLTAQRCSRTLEYAPLRCSQALQPSPPRGYGRQSVLAPPKEVFRSARIIGLLVTAALLLGVRVANAQEMDVPHSEALPIVQTMPEPVQTENPLDIMDNWKTSLMYSVEDMRSLNKILDAIRQRKLLGVDASSADFSLGDIPIATENLPKEAPAFYLNSILYRAPENWVLWINGKRVSLQENIADLTVEGVTANHVTLLWKTDHLNYISPQWQTQITAQKNITVAEDAKSVRFTLYPNQTFVTRAMQIIEGHGAASALGAPDGTGAVAEPQPVQGASKKKPSKARKTPKTPSPDMMPTPNADGTPAAQPVSPNP
jgi:hypothetical protein